MRSKHLAVLACVSAAAALLCAAPAFAGGHAYGHDKDPQTLPVEGSVSGAAATASQHQDQAQVAVGLGVGLGGAGGLGGSGGAGGAGGGGGQGGSASAGGGAASAYGGSASAHVGDVSSGPAIASTGAVDAHSQVSTGAVDAKTGDQTVAFVDKHPAATAVASASGGGGACPHYGPGVGVQTFGAGVSLSLPVFKDRDCVILKKVEILIALGRADIATNYLEKMDANIAAAAR